MSDPTDRQNLPDIPSEPQSRQEDAIPNDLTVLARALLELAGNTKSKKRLPEAESQYRWLGPAPIYCDHFAAQALNDNNIVRMSFGEYVGKEYAVIYRVGIALPLAETKRLIRTLSRIVKECEEEAGTDGPESSKK